MANSSIFWLGMVIYALVLLMFLYMTRKEQAVNHVPWTGAIVGFAGCILWPVTMAVFAVMAAIRGAREEKKPD